MFSNFTPQLVLPSSGNPYYNTKSSGGYNPCILGNPKNRNKGLNVLPNCVGYATGRFNEIGGYGSCKYLGNTNAANFIDLARKQGLLVTQRPTLGGCMVWKGGSTAEGHVAIVELDMGNTIMTSESEYYGKQFTIYRRFGSDWRDGCYWMGNSYTYLGCIVNPAVKENEKMTYEQFCEYMSRWLKENGEIQFNLFLRAWLAAQALMPADPWAESAIEYCKEQGLMVGDASGNFRPQSFTKREELAAVLMSLTTK